MCRLHLQCSAKECQKCSASSTENVPTLSRVFWTLYTRYERPDRSTTARESVSSIGACAAPKRTIPFHLRAPWRRPGPDRSPCPRPNGGHQSEDRLCK